MKIHFTLIAWHFNIPFERRISMRGAAAQLKNTHIQIAPREKILHFNHGREIDDEGT